MRIDFHSHILPGIDDGAKNLEESIRLLDMMAADHVDIVAATPHFYCTKSSIHRFLDKRARAFEKLKAAMKPEHPKVILGAEVLYDHALVGKEALSRLTIEGTDFMLLEMPYSKITPEIIEDVDKISNDFDVKLMIAHIERYLHFTSMSSLCELLDLNVVGQMNADSLTHIRTRSSCLKLVKNGYVQVLGSDWHRTERGDAAISKGLAVIEKKFGTETTIEIDKNSEMILNNCSIDELLNS